MLLRGGGGGAPGGGPVGRGMLTASDKVSFTYGSRSGTNTYVLLEKRLKSKQEEVGLWAVVCRAALL